MFSPERIQKWYTVGIVLVNIIDNIDSQEGNDLSPGAVTELAVASVPIYLSGAIRQELVGKPEFGFMRTPYMGNKEIRGVQWAADNGCYSSKGEREFNLDAYLSWLKMQEIETCLMATAPDKVGDAIETLHRSLPILKPIRDLGYPVAFVGQDRIEETIVPWDEFDVFFIGGTTDWKLGPIAKQYAIEARERGKWLHMGRVNSLKRYRYAMSIGCDSVDGTFLCFGPTKNLPRLFSWVEQLRRECVGR